jgi:phosphatidate cytidylyltransferase
MNGRQGRHRPQAAVFAPPPQNHARMLRTRVLTAVVLLLILAAAAAVSVAALAALGAFFLGAALFEWLRLAAIPRAPALAVAVLGAGTAWVAEALGWRIAPQALALLCALAATAWLAIALVLVAAQRDGVRLARGLVVAAAPLLATVAWFALMDLLRQGELWTLSVLVLVWLADMAAYFAGRAFGVAKLASRISPGKTWAGAWGALVAVVALAELVRWRWPMEPIWSTRILEAAPVGGVAALLVLVAASIVGDLFESLVKRQAGAKDSGWILPGHGGAWDRIDATLPVLPLAVLGQALLLGGVRHG